jgi:2-keto-4-pentenoate hydratase/2-oxohepta-3-ene-1,7-dioic acid hydratase in catechol pathway
VKLASYRTKDGDDFGIAAADGLVSLKKRLGYRSLRHLLADQGLDQARTVRHSEKPDARFSEIEFLPVIPDPGKFLCIGINYREFAQQMQRKVEVRPGVFSRFADTLVGHEQPIMRPKVSHQLDFEGELAVIIGKAGRYIPQGSAMEHVAGYSCFVDGSVRDYQKLSPTAGKNFPCTGPFGPWMVTADEVTDPATLHITTRLNGEVVQHSGTDMMIHSVAALISYLSEITALEPGDVISTGTPGGVGHRREPQLWLKHGDVLELEISGIGKLSNPIIDESITQLNASRR